MIELRQAKGFLILLGLGAAVALSSMVKTDSAAESRTSTPSAPPPISRAADDACADFAVSTGWLSSELSSQKGAYQVCVKVQQDMDAKRRAVRQ